MAVKPGHDCNAAERRYVRIVQCDNPEPHPKHGWVTANEDIGCPGVPDQVLALAKTLQTDRYQVVGFPHNKERPRDVGAPGAAT